MVPRKTLHARAAASEAEFDEIDGESEPSMKLSHAFIVVLVLHVLAVGGVFAFNTLKTKQILPDRPARATAAKAENGKPAPAAASAKPAAPAEAAPVVTYNVVAGDTLKRIATKNKTSIEALEKANDITGTAILHVGQVLRMPPAKSAGPAAKTAAPAPLPPAKTAAPKNRDANTSAKTPAGKETGAAVNQDSKTAKPDAASDKTDKTYVVAPGDNPYVIAKKFKVSYNDLLKANKIEDPKKLQIGQKLIIP